MTISIPDSRSIRHAVSLGTSRLTSEVIKRAGLSPLALPFDRASSGAGMIRQCVLDDFEMFLNRDRYVNAGHPRAWGSPFFSTLFASGTVFDDLDLSDDAEYGALVEAVDRFREIMRSSASKLFVMTIPAEHVDHPHVAELFETILSLTSNASFLTIGIREKAEKASLEQLTDDGWRRVVAFTPSSDVTKNLGFCNQSDNDLLQSVFSRYVAEQTFFDAPLKPKRRPRDLVGRSDAATLTLDIVSASNMLSRVDVETISSSSSAERPDPDFVYGYLAPERAEHFSSDRYLPPVRVSRVRNATLFGPFFQTGTIVKTGEVFLDIPDIASHPRSREATERLAQLAQRADRGEIVERHIPGEVLLLACNGHQIYGHWLVDFLPKLALLPQIGVSLSSVRMLLPSNMAGFGASLLDLVGIRDEQIIEHDPETQILTCDSLLIPSTLRWGGRCSERFGPAVWFLNNLINVPASGGRHDPRRIFLSRSLGGGHGRRLIGESELITIAEQFGFQALAPERLPLREQVALLRSIAR